MIRRSSNEFQLNLPANQATVQSGNTKHRTATLHVDSNGKTRGKTACQSQISASGGAVRLCPAGGRPALYRLSPEAVTPRSSNEEDPEEPPLAATGAADTSPGPEDSTPHQSANTAPTSRHRSRRHLAGS